MYVTCQVVTRTINTLKNVFHKHKRNGARTAEFQSSRAIFLCKIHLIKLKTFLFGNNGARLSIDADNTSSKDGLFNKTKKYG